MSPDTEYVLSIQITHGRKNMSWIPIRFQWTYTILDDSWLFSQYVQSGVGLVVCGFSPYATVCQEELTGFLKETTWKRTNNDCVVFVPHMYETPQCIYWHDCFPSRTEQVSFLSYFTDSWGYTSTWLSHRPRIVISSSWSTTYLSQGYHGYMVYIWIV